VPPALAAQAPPAQTAAQFYMTYREAVEKAKTMADVMPFLSAETRGMVEKTPVGERDKLFELFKMLSGMHSDVKVVREQRTASGVTLTLEATDLDKAKATGTVDIVREGDAWKIGKESWKG
jgi:hypothetical protein